MFRCILCFLLIIVLFSNDVSSGKVSRQKRCIVIQKQTGGHADSGESTDDEDYDYKRPQPKDPGLDRLQAARIEKTGVKKQGDVETISPQFLQYKAPPISMFRRLKLKDRIRNMFQ